MSAEARQDSVHVQAMSDSNYADSVNVKDVIMFSPYLYKIYTVDSKFTTVCY